MIHILVEKTDSGEGYYTKENILASFFKEVIENEKLRLEDIHCKNISVMNSYNNERREIENKRNIFYPYKPSGHEYNYNFLKKKYDELYAAYSIQTDEYNVACAKLIQYYIDNHDIDVRYFDYSIVYEIDSVEFK